jgi:hypothetical protein
MESGTTKDRPLPGMPEVEDLIVVQPKLKKEVIELLDKKRKAKIQKFPELVYVQLANAGDGSDPYLVLNTSPEHAACEDLGVQTPGETVGIYRFEKTVKITQTTTTKVIEV